MDINHHNHTPQDPDPSEDLVDLEDTFSHPDGLYAARYLVGALVKTAFEIAPRSAKDHTPSLVRTEASGSASLSLPLHLKEPGALERLLAFKGLSMSASHGSGRNLRAADWNGLPMAGSSSSQGPRIASNSLFPGNPRLFNIQASYIIQSSASQGAHGPQSSRPSNSTPPGPSYPSHHIHSSHHTQPSSSQIRGHNQLSHHPLLPRSQLPSQTAPHSSANRHINSQHPRIPLPEGSQAHRALPHSSRHSLHPSSARPQPQLQPQLLSLNSSLPRQYPSSMVPTFLPANAKSNINAGASNNFNIIHHSTESDNGDIIAKGGPEEPTTPSKKRKIAADDVLGLKKQKVNGSGKVKRISRPKAEKRESAGSQLPDDVWMRILEYSPPRFLMKARLVSKGLKELVDKFDSIFINCRKENFGHNMPPPPEGLNDRQYSDLLDGKGCQNPGCNDKLSARTHWSWSKRWCMPCWKSKIVREDRLHKIHAQTYSRTTLTKLLECIPVGMQDSFVKPHDFVVDDVSPRPRGAPRLYKVYLEEDVVQIFAEYEALTPAPYQEDPNHTPEQKSAAQAAHAELMSKLEEKRDDFFNAKKAENDKFMANVILIEKALKARRSVIREPHAENRSKRKELFKSRAADDLPHIPTEFVVNCKPYKDATRVFRDPGSERGWQMLKPKIQAAWDKHQKGSQDKGKLDAGLFDGTDTENETSRTRSVTPIMDVDGSGSLPPSSFPAANHHVLTSGRLYPSSQPLQPLLPLQLYHGPVASRPSQLFLHSQNNHLSQPTLMRRTNSANGHEFINGIYTTYADGNLSNTMQRSSSGHSSVAAAYSTSVLPHQLGPRRPSSAGNSNNVSAGPSSSNSRIMIRNLVAPQTPTGRYGNSSSSDGNNNISTNGNGYDSFNHSFPHSK